MQPVISHNFPRRLDKPLPMIKTAKGVWLVDQAGRRYLDASGGPLVVNIGHGREAVARAVYDQLMACGYVHPTMFAAQPVEDLADRLAAHAPVGIERFYFHSSGSEAVEAAIKMARQIHLARGEAQRFRLISRWNSYHGLTLGALSAGGRAHFRAPFAPLLTETVHIPAPYCLRCAFELTYPACRLRCARALEEAILQAGPETVSAFLAETVGGVSVACAPPPPDYLDCIRRICDRYGILLILDEVLCGMGRTGRWFASEHYGITPDLVTIGKGLAGGFVPLSAIGVRGEHFDAMCDSGAGFVHGGTFSHHPVATAAGVAVMEILEAENLVPRVARWGEILGNKLKESLGSHPNVGDVRGMGFMWGIELVAEKKSLTPFEPREKVAVRVWEEMFARGVVAYKAGGFAGDRGDALVLAPPFTIAEEDMDLMVDVTAGAITSVLG